jgi:hypothetical protein
LEYYKVVEITIKQWHSIVDDLYPWLDTLVAHPFYSLYDLKEHNHLAKNKPFFNSIDGPRREDQLSYFRHIDYIHDYFGHVARNLLNGVGKLIRPFKMIIG